MRARESRLRAVARGKMIHQMACTFLNGEYQFHQPCGLWNLKGVGSGPVRSGLVRSSVPMQFPRRFISVNPRNCTYKFPGKCISVNPRKLFFGVNSTVEYFTLALNR